MSTIPSSIARVPNSLASNIMFGAVTRASADLLDLQVKMATGQRINRPSDDAIGTSTVSVLDDLMERREQRLRNLSHAESVLGNLDAALGDLSGLLLEAKGVASSQIGVGSDEDTRQNQASVIDALLSEATNIANRKYQLVHLFSGQASGATTMEGLLSGLRYQGQGEGVVTDLGLSRELQITVSGEDAFGALSSRIEGDRDLDPILEDDTLITDLDGARGLGIGLGSITVSDATGASVEVDLTDANTIGEIASLIEDAIQDDLGHAAATVIVDPTSENRLSITAGAEDITIQDPASDATAADLGLSGITFTAGATTTGEDLQPRVTRQTPLVNLNGISAPLGEIRLQNLGQTRDLDLSSLTTVEDLINAVEGLEIGIRVEISEAGDRLSFINEASGGEMSIGEVGGGSMATLLGVRSLADSTRLEDFNNGLGVDIREGSIDPVTGLLDPTRDVDFTITLKDGAELEVDLADATTVGDVLDLINAAATDAGYTVGTDFEATYVDDGNGIRITDNTNGGTGTTTVASANGSFAAEDLGILGSTTSANLDGTDSATIAVDSLFSHLMSLRDALLANDERGITLAGEKLELDISRVAETRAEVGVRARRVVDAVEREEDLQIQDEGLMSQVRDLDFTNAAMRFGLLQQQLQAGLSTAGSALQLSLLDFI